MLEKPGDRDTFESDNAHEERVALGENSRINIRMVATDGSGVVDAETHDFQDLPWGVVVVPENRPERQMRDLASNETGISVVGLIAPDSLPAVAAAMIQFLKRNNVLVPALMHDMMLSLPDAPAPEFDDDHKFDA